VKTVVPESVRCLLWGVRLETLDLNRHRRFIIRRVLDFGDPAAVKWLRETYGDGQLREVVELGRGLHPKTLAFWNELFRQRAAR